MVCVQSASHQASSYRPLGSRTYKLTAARTPSGSGVRITRPYSWSMASPNASDVRDARNGRQLWVGPARFSWVAITSDVSRYIARRSSSSSAAPHLPRGRSRPRGCRSQCGSPPWAETSKRCTWSQRYIQPFSIRHLLAGTGGCALRPTSPRGRRCDARVRAKVAVRSCNRETWARGARILERPECAPRPAVSAEAQKVVRIRCRSRL